MCTELVFFLKSLENNLFQILGETGSCIEERFNRQILT